MEMNGSRHIAAPQDAVWQALNDPVALQACIPGCESLESTGPNQWRAVLAAKVGPVSARFTGSMRMEDIVAPASYALAFEGQGGAAGFANGRAKITLTPENGATLLSYAVNAQIGGKLAQIGSRLIDGAAAKLSEDFFTRFEARFAAPATAGEAITTATRTPAARRRRTTTSWVRYIAIAAILILLGVLYAKGGRL
jgi:carbon monoxide dehydrogenase subunit G